MGARRTDVKEADMTERSDGAGAGDGDRGVEPGSDEMGPDEMGPDERALLAGFDRLRPQGSLQWGFDDAMRRIAAGSPDMADVEPWRGLPDDIWDRGRGGKIARPLLAGVIGQVAEALAQDSREAAVGAFTKSNEAIWDAFRYLSARVEQLERAADPLEVQAGELALPVYDLSEWADPVATWTGAAPPIGSVVVGELGECSVFEALVGSSVTVEGVDPRGQMVWEANARLSEGSGEDSGIGSGKAVAILSEVTERLRSLPTASQQAVVLSGCIDRHALNGKVDALDQAIRVISPGGTLVLLVVDQAAWDGDLTAPVRDLLPGRPLHPETWLQILARRGLAGAQWHRPERGAVHAVVVRRDP